MLYTYSNACTLEIKRNRNTVETHCVNKWLTSYCYQMFLSQFDHDVYTKVAAEQCLKLVMLSSNLS